MLKPGNKVVCKRKWIKHGIDLSTIYPYYRVKGEVISVSTYSSKVATVRWDNRQVTDIHQDNVRKLLFGIW